MSGSSLYRTASVVFLLFAAGHTFGFLSFTPPTAEGIAVRDDRRSTHAAASSARNILAPYLAKAKALAVGLSNAYFKSLGLPSLFEDC
jgi:hypothetical protein